MWFWCNQSCTVERNNFLLHRRLHDNLYWPQPYYKILSLVKGLDLSVNSQAIETIVSGRQIEVLSNVMCGCTYGAILLQLPAHNCGIFNSPALAAHSPPHFFIAHFHTTFKSVPASHQPYFSSPTTCRSED